MIISRQQQSRVVAAASSSNGRMPDDRCVVRVTAIAFAAPDAIMNVPF